MDIKLEIARIEARCARAGIPVAELLRKADIASSQWQRWKTVDQVPLLTSWERVQAAAKALLR